MTLPRIAKALNSDSMPMIPPQGVRASYRRRDYSSPTRHAGADNPVSLHQAAALRPGSLLRCQTAGACGSDDAPIQCRDVFELRAEAVAAHERPDAGRRAGEDEVA